VSTSTGKTISKEKKAIVKGSVSDPEPDPDPGGLTKLKLGKNAAKRQIIRLLKLKSINSDVNGIKTV
jgi:hypothetical protein